MEELNFIDFKESVRQQLEEMAQHELYVVDVDKDILWNTYLDSFPPGTNKIYKERREYDCQCCKRFIRALGNVVSITNNKLVSVWDLDIDGAFKTVANKLSEMVKTNQIKSVFRHYERKVGVDYNYSLTDSKDNIKFNHFYFELPKSFIVSKDAIGTVLSDNRSNHAVLKRSLEEITIESAETVLELIEQNSLYRGEEHQELVEKFIKAKKQYEAAKNKDLFCWAVKAYGIRNTVIGTLLVDISDGKDINEAVRLFESKVAPTNYKRPSAIITKRMIDSAQNKIKELGYEPCLDRRFAVKEDVTINNVLFANRSTKKIMNVFDELKKDVSENIDKFKKTEEIGIEKFIKDVLPKVESIELMFENKYINNLMSLISPQNKEAENIFKWGNNFSWSYNGEVADSIKERVKKAGGNVNGVLRCSLSWYNYDDLDIHVVEPNGNEIYYSNARRRHPSSGILDVDMNVNSNGSRNAVENIVWTNKGKMLEGKYKLFIHNYTPREMDDVGFEVEIEHNGDIQTFCYDKRVSGKVTVAEFNYSKRDGLKFINSLPSSKATKEIWNINTNNFHQVSMVMNSPNHWDGEKTGNKHYFFMIEDCVNSKAARGFYNEFLKEVLNPHRKVFEILGSKMKAKKTDSQLSGIGFSSTQRNDVLCKVTGNFNRVLKIIF